MPSGRDWGKVVVDIEVEWWEDGVDISGTVEAKEIRQSGDLITRHGRSFQPKLVILLAVSEFLGDVTGRAKKAAEKDTTPSEGGKRDTNKAREVSRRAASEATECGRDYAKKQRPRRTDKT